MPLERSAMRELHLCRSPFRCGAARPSSGRPSAFIFVFVVIRSGMVDNNTAGSDHNAGDNVDSPCLRARLSLCVCVCARPVRGTYFSIVVAGQAGRMLRDEFTHPARRAERRSPLLSDRGERQGIRFILRHPDRQRYAPKFPVSLAARLSLSLY